MIDTGRPTEPSTEDLTRLAAAYRAMPQSRLLGALADGRSRAQAGHQLAMLLAAAGQGIEQRGRVDPPRWRELPFDGLFVVGDQLAVTGHDLIAGFRALGDADALVWSVDGQRVPAVESVGAVLRVAAALRAQI